jgi:hypothetical protein
MSNVPSSTVETALSAVRKHARVVIHFHPDRPALGSVDQPRTVSSALLSSGVYQSQFETGISNGSVSAWAGGARDEWERALFGGAYHGETASQAPTPMPLSLLITSTAPDERKPVKGPHLRPKYGALDLMRCADGPAPRFGSCFFVLRPEVTARTTFTFGGSQDLPKVVGTADEMTSIVNSVFEEAFLRDSALGVSPLRPAALMKRVLDLETTVTRDAVLSRNLDHLVEAQVHGDVLLARDIEELVVDPSFKGSETGTDLENMSVRYGFPIRWHPGYRLRIEDVPLDFRGPTMPSLAARVTKGGYVDAEAIGSGVQDLVKNPDTWKDRGSYPEVLQELKLLWHVLVRYGLPIE